MYKSDNKILKSVEPLLEREFNVRETLQVLQHNYQVYMSWGVSDLFNYKHKGLLFRVRGRHHKGFVFITLNWTDTYIVYIINNRGRILNKYEMIYFDMLADVIDDRIEKIKRTVNSF